MIAEVRLTYTVDVIVKGDDEDQIMDWAREHTPSEAVDDAQKRGRYPGETWDEEIISYRKDDAGYDIDITK